MAPIGCNTPHQHTANSSPVPTSQHAVSKCQYQHHYERLVLLALSCDGEGPNLLGPLLPSIGPIFMGPPPYFRPPYLCDGPSNCRPRWPGGNASGACLIWFSWDSSQRRSCVSWNTCTIKKLVLLTLLSNV